MSLQLKAFIQELRDAEISFELSDYRIGAISVLINVPGERWEVDFLDDGTVDVERFISNGEIRDEEALKELFARFDERNLQPKSAAKTGKSHVKKSKQLSTGGSSANRAVNKV